MAQQERVPTPAELRAKAVQSRSIYLNVNDLAQKLDALRQDMASAGFFKTYQALSEASRQLGWEAAEQIERKSPPKRRR